MAELVIVRSMSRVILILAVLVGSAGSLTPNQEIYPPLTRETLVGTWEGLIGIGTHPVVFHVVIAPRDRDSYLSEIYPDSMKGRLFRLESCTVADGKVTLHFTQSDGYDWWIEGEGYGDRNFAWINGRIGLPNKPDAGAPSFYLGKGTWVRELGEAAVRAAEKIPK
jgi:hypothetical protein